MISRANIVSAASRARFATDEFSREDVDEFCEGSDIQSSDVERKSPRTGLKPGLISGALRGPEGPLFHNSSGDISQTARRRAWFPSGRCSKVRGPVPVCGLVR